MKLSPFKLIQYIYLALLLWWFRLLWQRVGLIVPVVCWVHRGIACLTHSVLRVCIILYVNPAKNGAPVGWSGWKTISASDEICLDYYID